MGDESLRDRFPVKLTIEFRSGDKFVGYLDPAFFQYVDDNGNGDMDAICIRYRSLETAWEEEAIYAKRESD